MLNLNAISKEINKNAVAHGWWEGGRNMPQIRSLIHSEWSEALEEYRAGRPMIWYGCGESDSDAICAPADEADCINYGTQETCKHRKKKPEGIAVELIDGCIRILDYLAHSGFIFGYEISDLDEFMEICKEPCREIFARWHNLSVPELVDFLHRHTSMSALEKGGYNEFITIIGVVCLWIKENGFDPAEIMKEKHEYNKTRSYKRGGKVC